MSLTFCSLGRDGVVSVVNVKPADRLADPKVAEALGWAGAVFAERGWRHEIWTGAPAVQLANVRFLAAYRDPARLDPAVVTAVAETVGGPVRLERSSGRGRSGAARREGRACTWCGGAWCARTFRCRCRPRRCWSGWHERRGR